MIIFEMNCKYMGNMYKIRTEADKTGKKDL